MRLKRTHVSILGVVTLVGSFVLVAAASPTKKNCADDQDGSCTLDVDGIYGNNGIFSSWVQASQFFGTSGVFAGSSNQTELNASGLFASVADVNTAYADTVYSNNLTTYGTINAGAVYASYKSFRIDNPVDPANRVLNHWSVESSEMKNIYDGVVTLDANGAAQITMPSWFDALNTDFRYQLTAIGAPAANLYVAEEIAKRQFKIAGGKPHLKVSWQVTGVRHDASARNNHTPIEEDKAPENRGKYIDPAAFGQPVSMGLNHYARPERSSTNRPGPHAK
jgi:hypothetical protein